MSEASAAVPAEPEVAAGAPGTPGAAPYREITFAAVGLGVIQGIVMTMAFVYAGLKLGFTLGGSTVAAIMGFVILKGVMRTGSIVENNINQTIASGINIASAGVIFTVPALLLMGKDFGPLPMTLAAVAGSFLGICVIVPLRKQMIDFDRLRFPSGTAVAAILKSPGAGMQKAKLLAAGVALSLGVVLCTKWGIIDGDIEVGKWVGLPDFMVNGPTAIAISVSLMNFGAGLLSGKGGLPFFLGGCLAFLFVSPAAVSAGWTAEVATEALPGFLYGSMIRPLGIGLLIGGALAGVVVSFPAIKGAIKSLQRVRAASGSSPVTDEMPVQVLYAGLIGSVIVLFIAAIFGADSLGLGTAGVIAIVGTIWLALAGIIVAQATGMTDISPLSGLALIAVTLMLAITGGNVVAAVIIGVAVCVATSQCADMMQDLKTGYLVGGKPVKQQKVQFLVAWIGPIVAMGTMYLLWHTPDGTPGFGPNSTACLGGGSGCLPAPQAGALEAMIQGVLSGNAPIEKYVAGGVLGASLSFLPIGGLGVLVGLAMYLPFSITFGYGLGCLTSMAIQRAKGVRWIENKIVPLAAGLIVGEALTELTYSILILAGVVDPGSGGH